MTRAIELDFETKTDREVDVKDVKASIAGGKFVWLDVDGSDPEATREVLRATVCLEERLLDECLALTPNTKYDLRASWLHLVIAAGGLTAGELEEDRVDVIVGQGFLVSIHRDRVPFLERVRERYHEDFVRFARSHGFLIYEIWDALLEGFEEVNAKLDHEVELMQHRILTRFDDTVFEEFARLGNDLLHLRKILAPTRNVLDELANRKSPFVPEGTQPYLGGMIPRVERILQDVTVSREILQNALGLHVAIGDHKLNRSMQKLTVLSAVFLPLTFLCGVYGMNFEHQPEFKWELGYAFFWTVATSIVVFVLWAMWRLKLM